MICDGLTMRCKPGLILSPTRDRCIPCTIGYICDGEKEILCGSGEIANEQQTECVTDKKQQQSITIAIVIGVTIPVVLVLIAVAAIFINKKC